jgi:hypothetical protein
MWLCLNLRTIYKPFTSNMIHSKHSFFLKIVAFSADTRARKTGWFEITHSIVRTSAA